MKEIKITVPYPISTNDYLGWMVAGSGGKRFCKSYVKKTTEEFKELCADELKKEVARMNQELDDKIVLPVKNIKFEAHVIVYPKLPKAWKKLQKEDPDNWELKIKTIDIDNSLKVLFDSFNNVLYGDDRKIWRIVVERGYPIENGGAEVVFKEYIPTLLT
jgi:Holliday junction resolvase RusA-like endonuclease